MELGRKILGTQDMYTSILVLTAATPRYLFVIVAPVGGSGVDPVLITEAEVT